MEIAKQINSVNRTEENTAQPTPEERQTVFPSTLKITLAAFTLHACPPITELITNDSDVLIEALAISSEDYVSLFLLY